MSKAKPTHFAQTLADFLFSYLPDQRGLSENTIASYSDAIALFLTFCECELHIRREKITIEDLSMLLVEKYLNWLESSRHCSVSTRNQRQAALNSFFKYLQYKNPGYIFVIQQIRSIPRKAHKAQTVNHLTQEGVKAILSSPDLSTREGRRDCAILSLMYEAAARVSEVVALNIDDLRFNYNGSAVQLMGKGSKPRIVPLTKDVSAFLKRYIQNESTHRMCSAKAPLFCNRMGQRITRAGISYILKKYAQSVYETSPDLLPERVYPHILRHSRAMHWLEAGIDLVYIKDLLGHSELLTTEVYAKLNTEMKRKVLDKVQPVQVSNVESWTDDKSLMAWLSELAKK